MRSSDDDDSEDETVFYVPLDDESVARLMELSEATHTPPAMLIASITHDVLRDDEAAHRFEDMAANTAKLN